MEREILRVLSRRAPALSWHCPKCHEPSIFQSTELFRANANGKLIDIWLTYRCRRCGTTRNLAVVERTPVRSLPVGLLEAAQTNDPKAARRFARDLAVIRRRGARVAEGDMYDCSAPARPLLGRAAALEVMVEFPEPLLLRVDELLASVFALPRTKLRELLDSGGVTVETPGKTNTLRVWDSLTVRVGAHIPQPAKSTRPA